MEKVLTSTVKCRQDLDVQNNNHTWQLMSRLAIFEYIKKHAVRNHVSGKNFNDFVKKIQKWPYPLSLLTICVH